MVAVPDEEIARAVVYLLERAKLVVEPAGAVGVAALLAGAAPRARGAGLRHAQRGQRGHQPGGPDHRARSDPGGRYLVLRTRLDDRPGQLGALLRPLSAMRVNVIDIEHHRAGWLCRSISRTSCCTWRRATPGTPGRSSPGCAARATTSSPSTPLPD